MAGRTSTREGPWAQDWRDYFLAIPNVHNGLLALLEGSRAAREDWLVYRNEGKDPASTEPVTSIPEAWITAFWDAVPNKDSRWADFSERTLVEGTPMDTGPQSPTRLRAGSSKAYHTLRDYPSSWQPERPDGSRSTS